MKIRGRLLLTILWIKNTTAFQRRNLKQFTISLIVARVRVCDEIGVTYRELFHKWGLA